MTDMESIASRVRKSLIGETGKEERRYMFESRCGRDVKGDRIQLKYRMKMKDVPAIVRPHVMYVKHEALSFHEWSFICCCEYSQRRTAGVFVGREAAHIW